MGYPIRRGDGVRLAAPDPAILAETPLFGGLPAGELSEARGPHARGELPSRIERHPAEQPGEAVYFVLNGSVKVPPPSHRV